MQSFPVYRVMIYSNICAVFTYLIKWCCFCNNDTKLSLPCSILWRKSIFRRMHANRNRIDQHQLFESQSCHTVNKRNTYFQECLDCLGLASSHDDFLGVDVF